VKLDADFGLAIAHGVLEDVDGERRSRDRPVDKIERADPLAFAELLELAQLGDVIEREAFARDRPVPVELFLGVDGEQESLAEAASEPGPGFGGRNFGNWSDRRLAA
jgi:hypothetical protein